MPVNITTTDLASAGRPSIQKPPVTIFGGGLAGVLTAIYLARREYTVHVYERRPDSRLATTTSDRSFNLTLSTRAVSALKKIGIHEEVLRVAVPMYGRVVHKAAGGHAFQPYDSEGNCTYSLSRDALLVSLLNLTERYPLIKLNFEHTLEALDSASSTAVVMNLQTRHSKTIETGVVIGADGVGSRVRESFLGQSGFSCSREYIKYGYKELHIPKTESGEPALSGLEAIHVWPRGDFMMLAFPNPDKSFTATLFMNISCSETVGFNQLDTPDKVAAFMTKHFPDVAPSMLSMVHDFLLHPVGTLCTVRCNTYHFNDNTMILGDAAHGVVPFYGQGCNCAFEDVSVLDTLLDTYDDDWSRVLPQFSKLRVSNGNKLADLSLKNFEEIRSKVGSSWVLLKKKVENILQKTVPGYRPLYALVCFSNTSYVDASNKARKQDFLLYTFVMALVLFMVGALWSCRVSVADLD